LPGPTQREPAERAGLSVHHLYEIEACRRKGSSKEVSGIAGALEVEKEEGGEPTFAGPWCGGAELGDRIEPILTLSLRLFVASFVPR